MSLSSDNSASSVVRAACATDFDQSFGKETMLNFGAAGEPPIRHNSISKPKKRVSWCVISFNQSRAARCSSLNRSASHTTVTACRPAA